MSSLRVACIPGAPLLQARLKDAVGGQGSVVAFPDPSSALPSILRGEIRCSVVAVDGDNIQASLTVLRVLQQLVPSHAVVAWCDRRALSSRQLLDIAQSGVAELVLRDVDDIKHVLGRILSAASQRSHALVLEARLGSFVPDAIRPVFRFMLENAHQAMDVDRIAAAFGITRQTLRNRMILHRMPLPRTFMTWSRLLVAGSLLQESGHTLDSVAWQLDFNSGHHLGTVLRRYAGAGVSEMRAAGVSSAVESSFRAALSGLQSHSFEFEGEAALGPHEDRNEMLQGASSSLPQRFARD
ncbi:MAG: helix-turn-helix domain-containing protein [Gemmatimonas sp.]